MFGNRLSAEAEAADESDSLQEHCLWAEDLRFFMGFSDTSDAESSYHGDCIASPSAIPTTLRNEDMADRIRKMTAAYPLAQMAETIARFDRDIAGLIVGIAKKESNWGKRVPRLNGEECFNYWGYRGTGSRGVTSDGYGCFATPEEAVEIIGSRLVTLALKRDSTDPRRMIVWKCGSSCSGHSPQSVEKWIADVSMYYRQITQP